MAGTNLLQFNLQ